MRRGPKTPAQAVFMLVVMFGYIGYSAWDSDRARQSSPSHRDIVYPDATPHHGSSERAEARHDVDASKIAVHHAPARDDVDMLPSWLPLAAAGTVGLGCICLGGLGFLLLRRRDHDEAADKTVNVDFAFDDPDALAQYDDDELRQLMARHDG